MSPAAPQPARLLDVSNLHKCFRSAGRSVHALLGVSFAVARGETLALVGESGSGKSTIGRILLRLERADRGDVFFAGEPVPVTQTRRVPAAYRQRVQMVFQDPFASLNGVNRVRYHLERPLLRHRRANRATLAHELEQLLDAVGLAGASDLLERHPHELSGGQRQRVALARALAPGPALLVADEPTSMLDVSIRMGVLKLLARLQRERGLSIVFITHDLASARFLADRVVVLYAGQVMESGRTAEVLSRPAHPYTRLLLAASPGGSAVAQVTAPPTRTPRVEHEHDELRPRGCPFAARCREATPTCARPAPLVPVGVDHDARCHLLPAAGRE